jgi:predicted ribosome quality control (RQC) complex YloA/Tae2 family protein
METRNSGKSSGKLQPPKETELDIIRNKLDEQEQRLSAERKAMREEQERFEREREMRFSAI